MAADSGVCPAPLGTRHGRRSAPPLAAADTTRTAYSCTGAPRLLAPAPAPGQPGLRAKTPRTLARTSQRQALTTCQTLPSGQIDGLTRPFFFLDAHHLMKRRSPLQMSATRCWLKGKLRVPIKTDQPVSMRQQ